MEILVAFMAGAVFGLLIASLAAVSSRCEFEEEIRAYYRNYYREGKHGYVDSISHGRPVADSMQHGQGRKTGQDTELGEAKP